MTEQHEPAPIRAGRWGLVVAGALIGITAAGLLAVIVTLSNDRCEQASRLLSDLFVTDEVPPADLATVLPERDPVTGAVPDDRTLDAEEVARAFSDPGLGRPLLDEHGFEAGFGRSWRGEDALATAWVLTFERVAGATAFARELVVLTCDHAEEIFGVSGIRGGVGLRLRSREVVQDEVVFPRGSMVFVVGYTYPGSKVGPTRVAEQLARAASQRTG